MKKHLSLLAITFFLIVLIGFLACPSDYNNSTSENKSKDDAIVAVVASCECSPGNTYNYSSQKCCDNLAPYYYPGTHGIAEPGCYKTCPYVGDCGTRFRKC